MIDAYDALNIDLDAEQEDIKKAYRRLSLQLHPDKVGATGANSEDAKDQFIEIKRAFDILSDVERRKIHDTFGVDLGEERPELEVWNLGIATLVSPVGHFLLKTFVMRAVIWLAGWTWIGYLVFFGGLVAGCLYAANIKIRGIEPRSQDFLPFYIAAGIGVGVVLLVWIWQLLADTVGLLYLLSETFIDVTALVENPKVLAGAAVGSLFAAWLVRGWWFWILLAEVAFVLVAVIAVIIASELVRLWIDGVKTQHGEKLKTWRLRLRSQRSQLQAEVASLKRKLGEPVAPVSPAAASLAGRARARGAL